MLLGSSLSSKDNKKTASRPTTTEKWHRRIERILYKLEEEKVIEDIIDVMEETGVIVNEFKSVEEIKKYLKQEADSWHSKQLTRIQSEHNYASSSLTKVTPYEYNELSDEGYVSPCEENAVTFESNPSSKIYHLREIKKFKKEENCICCK